jgi:ribonuclease P protein component
MNDAAPRLRFTSAQRLHGQRAFGVVYQAATRKPAGPLLIFAKPNDKEQSRLGLSVSRKVGNAVRRNRIKRLLREAFRLDQHELPAGYDWIVVVRQHEPLELGKYRQHLMSATGALDKRWCKRQKTEA